MNIGNCMRKNVNILIKSIFCLTALIAVLLAWILWLYLWDKNKLIFCMISIMSTTILLLLYKYLKSLSLHINAREKLLESHIEKLKLLADKDKLINTSMKEAKYLALQNQINPHFLYNTLEGIRSEALIAGIDSIAEMTEALATFFRYTISHLDRLVSLEEELENVENYYYIQQFRFGERLDLKIEYEHDEDILKPDILNFSIPKLTLQPIIENAIFHGIEKNVEKGCIRVIIGVRAERLLIRVSDNGAGMEEEKLLALNEKLSSLNLEQEQQGRGGIALINVNNRVKLLFGEEYGLYVYSNIGTGTDVEISLPLVRK